MTIEVPEKDGEIPLVMHRRKVTLDELREKFPTPPADGKKIIVGAPSTAAPPHIIERGNG
jgi:hypothetical protein